MSRVDVIGPAFLLNAVGRHRAPHVGADRAERHHLALLRLAILRLAILRLGDQDRVPLGGRGRDGAADRDVRRGHQSSAGAGGAFGG